MTNPLATADPNELDELYDRDPLELTEDDLQKIENELIRRHRIERQVWLEAQKNSQETGKKVSGVAVKKQQKEEVKKQIRAKGGKIDISKISNLLK